MPANYALHRFGAEALQRLPGEIRRPAQRFRRLYNAGLHGMDLLFYYNPVFSTKIGGLYGSCNAMTGADFFAGACDWLKKNPTEGATACLYGLLGHYCLKSSLAPLIREAVSGGDLTSVELEVELDRYLLGLDGKTPAHTFDLSPELKLTRGECVAVAGFFPPATAAHIHRAVRHMTAWIRRMASKNRSAVTLLLGFTGGDFRHQMMPDHANHKCMHLDKPMLACWQKALERYPIMAQQLNAFLTEGTPLGEDFTHPFA